ncbi:MAG: hypothetical protein KF774_09785 [Planctomyces sp.]|nr:hypothetical protein [Planctomyces sp.]
MNLMRKFYLALGSAICSGYLLACVFGWKAPDIGAAAAFGSLRSSGGSWGGGK